MGGFNHRPAPPVRGCRTAGSRSLRFPLLEGIREIATRAEGRDKSPPSAETAQGGSRELGWGVSVVAWFGVRGGKRCLLA